MANFKITCKLFAHKNKVNIDTVVKEKMKNDLETIITTSNCMEL